MDTLSPAGMALLAGLVTWGFTAVGAAFVFAARDFSRLTLYDHHPRGVSRLYRRLGYKLLGKLIVKIALFEVVYVKHLS